MTSRLLPALLLLPLLGLPLLHADDEAAEATGAVFLDAPPFREVLDLAASDGKPVFIDFRTEWCGWCDVLEEEVFSRPDVAEVLHAGFVLVCYDAEQGEGEVLADRYFVSAFPTLLVLDARGEEIDRIVGYRPSPRFLAEVDRIQRDEDTLRALARRWEAHPDHLETGLALAQKLVVARPPEGADLLLHLEARARQDAPYLLPEILLARAEGASDAGDWEAAVDLYETTVREFPRDSAAREAARAGAGLLLRVDPVRGLRLLEPFDEEDLELAEVRVRLLLSAAGRALRTWSRAAGEDGEVLNEVAWTAFLHGLEPEAALQWARRAVELTGRAPYVLDTQANLLFALGRVDDAVELQREAVRNERDPELRRQLMEVFFRMRAVQLFRRMFPAVR